MPKPSTDGNHDRVIRLADGRRLGYLEIGDPRGYPVVSCHGGLSSRLDVLPAADTASALGVRVIAPDRPGVGLSTRLADRTLLDWPTDVVELTEQLGVQQFAVMGWSLGGPYAMACAWALASRVTGLGVVAGTVPVTWPNMVDELNRTDRALLRLSERHPLLERSVFRLMHTTAVHAPGLLAKRTGLDGRTGRVVTAATAQGLANPWGVLDEYQIFNAPWGFEPEAVTTPTHVWQGSADDLVPEIWGRRLAEAVPRATLHAVEEATHFLWYDHWSEILASLSTHPN